jgi:hypothetical protein
MFLMSSPVKKSDQCHLPDKKHQYFSIVTLPTDSVIVDHALLLFLSDSCQLSFKVPNKQITY